MFPISLCMKIILSLATLSLVLVMAYTKSWHHIAFTYSKESVKEGFFKNTNYRVVHILGGKCACSRVIAEYLIQRGARTDIVEEVIIIDTMNDYVDQLKAKNYLVEHKSIKDFENKIDLSGVPFFIVHNNEKKVEYIGGYTESSITPHSKINDIAITDSVLQNRSIASLPVFGCAQSKAYQSITDPLGLKYGAN